MAFVSLTLGCFLQVEKRNFITEELILFIDNIYLDEASISWTLNNSFKYDCFLLFAFRPSSSHDITISFCIPIN